LAEGEPVALDLEVIVGEGGTAEAGDVVGELAQSVPFAIGVGFGVDVASHGDVLELGPEEEFGGEGKCGMRSAECGIVRIVACRGCIVLIVRFGLAEISFPLTPALSLGERENVWLGSVLVVLCRRFEGSRTLRGRGVRLVTSAATGLEELEEVSGVVLEEPIAVAALFPIGEVLFGDRMVVGFSEDGFGFGEGVEPGEDGFGGEVVVEFEVELFADGVREASDFTDARNVVFHND
jgi:hypothetical protein